MTTTPKPLEGLPPHFLPSGLLGMPPHLVREYAESYAREALRSQAASVEPVAEVVSWTNGSYHRNYKLKWLKDVEAGTKLYVFAPPAHIPADVEAPPGKNWHAHHVIVGKAALQMVRNALKNDVERGLTVRGEMLAELDAVTYPVQRPTPEPAQAVDAVDALQKIADWNSHTSEFAVDYGSNGVRDFYRAIAREALQSSRQPQAQQGGGAIGGAVVAPHQLAALVEAYVAAPLRMLIGEGHSGHGLYVAQSEYQDEGAVLLAEIPAVALTAQAPAAAEPVPFSGADETPPVFGRRWKLAVDGFGLQRDDLEGNYVHIDDALSVLHQAAQQAAQAPEGWVLVPKVATNEMIQAGALQLRTYLKQNDGYSPRECWAHMLAARPQAEGA